MADDGPSNPEEVSIPSQDGDSSAAGIYGLEVIASVSRALRTVSPDDAFAQTLSAIQAPLMRVSPLRALCFVVPGDDGLSFEIGVCEPESEREALMRELDAQIENSTFGWALNQSRVVITDSLADRERTLFHALTGRTRTIGMLMALLPVGSGEISDPDRKLISILLLHATSALEGAALQIELRENNAQLEVRVEERTAELRRLRDKADMANAAKSKFLANMSHELRTPMNGVIGMTEILGQTNLDGQQRECVDLIGMSAESLLTMINEVLDFSKLEVGRVDIERIDFRIRDIAQSTVDLLAERAAKKNLDLSVFVDEAIPVWLRGDSTRIGQVLTNLIGNAIKFTDEGYVSLRVSIAHSSAADERDQLLFEVTDTGIGMSEDVLANLFTPFSQADASITRRFGGTGLGLAICRGLTDLMAGEIGVESTPGEGTRFWMLLDILHSEEVILARPLCQAGLEGRAVLVVDPNAQRCDNVLHYCRAWGMSAAAESRLAGAVSALENLPSDDVLICAGEWAKAPGGGLADAIDAAQARGCKLLIMTALSQADEPGSSRECASIRRPIHREALHDGLCNLFELSTLADDAAGTGSTASNEAPPHADPLLDCCLLLVEDNKVNQRVAVKMLERIGAVVDLANNGVEALELLQDREYDAILMDCQMPEMDGYTTTRKIREGERASGKHVPIIAMTANALVGDRDRCISAGMDDYLTKPVRFGLIRETLLRWISDKPTDAE